MNSHFLEVPLCDLPITLPPYTSELNPVEVQCRSIRKATGNRIQLQKIDYKAPVWVLNYNNPKPLLDHAIYMLEKHGVRREDMEITETPTAKVGAVVVEIWPYELVVGRVRSTRNDSFISGTEFAIELRLDDDGNYVDYLEGKEGEI